MPASIKASSENHSGDVNKDSETARFAFHIPSESDSTISRNRYSPFPGTLIHMPRIPHNQPKPGIARPTEVDQLGSASAASPSDVGQRVGAAMPGSPPAGRFEI